MEKKTGFSTPEAKKDDSRANETKKILQSYPLFYKVILVIGIFFILGVFVNLLTSPGGLKIFIGILAAFVAVFVIYFIGTSKGRAKAKRELKKQQKILKKNNPYTYLRELPNSFGIGVTSLLFDSTLENEKDIVAVILDLCARKYLRLEKQPSGYSVRVLKGADEHLLSNEKYILDLVIGNRISEINYKEWFNCCVKDGNDLGLYSRNDVDANIDQGATRRKIGKLAKFFLVLDIILSSFMLLYAFDGILSAIFMVLCLFVVLAIVFYLISIPITIITGIVNFANDTAKGSYAKAMNNNLKRTAKGIEELYKLMSFELFIKDFGNFVEKSAEEVVLWDRYLSYAQVFGLTDEIMKNGYNELINNASFSIDNIDNISLSVIETV